MRNLIQRFEKAVVRKKVVRHRCATVLAASALMAAICAYGQMSPEAATTGLASSSDWEETDSSGDAVREVTYEIDDGRIIGYALVPESEVYTLTYTGDDYAVIVSYGSDALVPEDAELMVTEYDSDSEVWQNRYEETARLYGWEDEETEEIASDSNSLTMGTVNHGFRLFDIDVCADGEVVELAAEATVYISLRANDEPESCMVTGYTGGAADIGAVTEYESGSQIVTFGAKDLDSYGISLTTIEDAYTILNFEGEDYVVTVTYDEEAGLPEGTELSVSEFGMDSETWHNRYDETAKLYGWTEEDAYAFRLFDISLLADGEKIEPNADVKVVISFLNRTALKDYTVTHYGEEKTETIEAISEFEEGTQSISFDAAEFSDYGVSEKANPTFTVQYYAYLDVVSSNKESGTLQVFDTSKNGDGKGGNLPENKIGNNITYINLESIEGKTSKYKVATVSTLTQVYSDKEYKYNVAPGLYYFNRLKSNDGYSLSQIWVLKGTDSSSTSTDDWDIYTYNEGTTSFTNTESEKTDSVIYIDDNSVIRLVYNIVEKDETLTANLYDYNITDGNLYTKPDRSTTTTDDTGKVYVYTVEQGINSGTNYNGNGSKLAFGNNNTGTGLADQLWNGYTLNMANTNVVDKGCTFGLVASLDTDNNKIVYSDDVNAPNLFSDGDANGKTAFPAQDITFLKEGDTYTIKSISGSDGVEVDSLNEFYHLTGYTDGKGDSFSIYTNSFWPLDDVKTYNGQDLKFGDVYSYRNSMKNYITSSSSGLALPISDDSLVHNSYFGMEYAVEFTLSEDYVGPLNYYFFGDDDMWVFLDETLVCDIGGVHSSVGEYVDLWDYIEKGTEGTHTLSFFYTERGASGSSCYMRFTLPSVTDATLVQGTGNLRVEKEVSGTGADSRTGFEFSLGLTDSTGNTLIDTYGYRIYNSDNTESSTGTITNNGTFTLTDGQYIIVSYLPVGTICTVTENTTGYVTTYTVDKGTSKTDTSAEANITENKTVTIHFLNTREFTLPQSGGSGTWMFASLGAALCGATGVVFCQRRRRRV